MFRFIFCIAALSICMTAHAEKEICADGKQHYRATVRHIESGGIGYTDGYTTFEAFLAPDPNRWVVTPFLDARAHVFNNGPWAANIGAGLRILWGHRAYGINTYYDYRNTGLFNSNQIGVGLETLGKIFDFRINGYFPISKKTTGPYNPAFNYFSGNYMFVSQQYQSAMKGADAEFGFHLGTSEVFDVYAAVGPYYFVGEKMPTTWGGKARIIGVFKNIVSLEISDSYDRTFHNKVQGQIALTLSFGPKSKTKKQQRTCKLANTLNDRMLQPVGRQEIIVVDTTQKTTVAIDPVTGLPYFFVFVDNTSSSDGTYESPYHTFAQAEAHSSPNDIIYVFPGDGTTRGMDSGITLKTSQRLWGSGVDHYLQATQGNITIPPQSTSFPTITNTNVDTDGNAVTLSSNNSIGGLIIASTRIDAIYGTNLQSLEVDSCIFKDTRVYTINATFPGDASISLTNNQFVDNENGIYLVLRGTSTVNCSNNQFLHQTSDSSIPFDIKSNNNSLTALIANNLFDNNKAGSIRCTLTNVDTADITIFNNVMTNNQTGSQGIGLGSNIVISTEGSTTADDCLISLRDNIFSGNTGNSLYLHTDGAFGTIDILASNNIMSNNLGSGLNYATPANRFSLVATDNIITGLSNHGIALGENTSIQTANITINNNTISNIGSDQSAIAISKPSSTLNFTARDNTINNCTGSGMLFYATEFTNMTANITGNVISNCQNNGSFNAASAISIDTYVNFTGTIANNTLSNNLTPSVGIGLFTTGNPNVCVNLTGNSTDTDPGYSLTNPGSGAFNLSPCNASSVNTGTISTSGTVTSVQSCSSLTPCGS